MIVVFRVEQAGRRRGEEEDQGLPVDRREVIQGPGDRGADLEAVDAVRFPVDLDRRPFEAETRPLASLTGTP